MKRITISLILILKTLKSSKFTIRSRKSGVRINADGSNKVDNNATSLILKTSSLMCKSINAAQVLIKYNEFDDNK